MKIDDIFKIAVKEKASDVHLVNNSSPILRIDGELVLIDKFLSEEEKKSIKDRHPEKIKKENEDQVPSGENDDSVDKYFLYSNEDLIKNHAVDEDDASENEGEVVGYDLSFVNNQEMRKAIKEMLTKNQEKRFFEEKDLDFSYEIEDNRFRLNLSFEKGNIKLVARVIKSKLPTMEDLQMPSPVYDLLRSKQGLILVTGPTGSGKSTSLAAMIEYINNNRNCNIITLEDPIEYIFESKKSVISQRQLGTDMPNFASGLRHVLRQDPDVIMVGEMRDLETISTAITLAETGHLVLATLHTCSASQTIDRIIDIFPPHQQNQIKSQLSLILSAVISQVLVPKKGGGRVAVRELMLNNPAVSNLIREQKIAQIKSVIETHSSEGMVSFEKDIKRLAAEGTITLETAKNLLDNRLFSD
jgi:twitching motility protein PilT